MNYRGLISTVFSLVMKTGLRRYLLAVTIIGLVALVCSPLSGTSNYHIVSFVLLFVVSILATFLGIGPVLVASTLSALVWNYLFIPPQFTFHIEKTEDILMFAMFFIIALLNGILTTRIRRQEKLALEREWRTNALFHLTGQLSKAGSIEEVMEVGIQEIREYFSVDSCFVLNDGSQKQNIVRPMEPGTEQWSDHRIFDQMKGSGKGIYDGFVFYRLKGARLNPGLVALKSEVLFEGDKKVFWETFIAQISVALEREFLGGIAQKAKILDESDRLYKTLFNSISHELRIPVATILGASDSLLSSSHPENIREALYNEIFTASLRLNRLIENLLNMSRLESGRISVRLDWYDINDLVNKVTGDLSEELKPFSLAVSIADEMPLARIDFGLMEQVLYNLLVNSCQHAPPASEIRIEISHLNDELVIRIIDHGPGFSDEDLKQVFRKFYRTGTSRTGGLGLGLSIVKGFAEAHKGHVSVKNRNEGGAEFTVIIPSGNPEMDNLSFEKE